MKVRTTHGVDVLIDGKVKTLKSGTHDLPNDVAQKLVRTGAGAYVETSKAKVKSDEA